MEPLSTVDINHILMNNSVTSRHFIGTYPACVLPTSRRKQYSFITNVDAHDEQGQHWTAWSVKNDTVSFFDSFGRKYDDETLPTYFSDIVDLFDGVTYSARRVQSWTSVACGHFSIHFLYLMSLGLDYSYFLNEYSINFEKNDEIVNAFFRSISM
jgi:hypothetical protein